MRITLKIRIHAELQTELGWCSILQHSEKIVFFSPENILSISLRTAYMSAKRQGECGLKCNKHCTSFPTRDQVSYHLKTAVVVLMDDLFISTCKSYISMVTLGFIIEV